MGQVQLVKQCLVLRERKCRIYWKLQIYVDQAYIIRKHMKQGNSSMSKKIEDGLQAGENLPNSSSQPWRSLLSFLSCHCEPPLCWFSQTLQNISKQGESMTTIGLGLTNLLPPSTDLYLSSLFSPLAAKNLLLNRHFQILLRNVSTRTESPKQTLTLQRIRQVKEKCQWGHSSTFLHTVLTKMPSMSHQLIFISANRKHPLCVYDLFIWSMSSEMLLLLQAQGIDGVSARLEQCLRNISQSIIVFLVYEMPTNTSISIINHLLRGVNIVLFQRIDPIPELNEVSKPMVFMQNCVVPKPTEYQHHEDTASGSIYCALPPPVRLYIMSQFSILLDIYNENCRNIWSEPVTEACHAEVLTICHNLTLIKSRQEGRKISMLQAFFDFADHLVRESSQCHPPTNNEVFCQIGILNHNPALMDHCLKCIVCRLNSRGRGKGRGKCHRSKYTCEGCSIYFERRIYLCLSCFRIFHQKMQLYMAGGTSRRGSAKLVKAELKELNGELKLQDRQ